MPELAVEETLFGLAAAAAPSAVVVGAPLDVTKGCRDGGGDGPAAIRAASRSLESYSLALDRDLCAFQFADRGDLELGDDVEAAVGEITDVVAAIAAERRLPVLLGGEHTVSLGAVRALTTVHPELTLLQIDAHTDLRTTYEGETVSRATWVMHSGISLDRVVQAGVRSSGGDVAGTTLPRVAHSSHALDVPRELLADRPVYLTIDIDVLDPSAAPGVRCPEPAGVSMRELLDFVHGLGGLNVVGMDVVEVSPDTDPAGLTALAAAVLLRELLLLFA
jgi:agmatinase